MKKRETKGGTELANLERVWTLGKKENCKYLGIFEADFLLQRKDFLRGTRKLLEQNSAAEI